MSLPPVGTRMLRIDDGRKGAVELAAPPGAEAPIEPRIVYYDRGERIVAPKQEKWEPEIPGKRPPLRAEEKLEVALWADRALDAIDNHVPLRHWERPSLAQDPYDPDLVLAIIAYLSARA